jgi:putative SOS response-associated peptidase YedK
MCGRIALYSDPPRLARLLEAGIDRKLIDHTKPSWNVGPTSEILGVAEDRRGQRHLSPFRWGLVPWWAKDPTAIKGTFNARAESLSTKPMFRSAFSRSRILIPADAFYEWKDGKPKQPYAFKRADGEPIVFAGLGEHWKGDGGTELWTATIITTGAGPDMPIHNRQPVVLEPGTWGLWLDAGVTEPEELEPLMKSTEAGTLIHYPVSRDVGDVRNDNPTLIEEADI